MGALVSSKCFLVSTHYYCHVDFEGGFNLPLPDEDCMPRNHCKLLFRRYNTWLWMWQPARVLQCSEEAGPWPLNAPYQAFPYRWKGWKCIYSHPAHHVLFRTNIAGQFKGKTNNFMHPSIKDLCIRLFYNDGRQSLARTFDEFKTSIPERAVILAATCVRLTLCYAVSCQLLLLDLPYNWWIQCWWISHQQGIFGWQL